MKFTDFPVEAKVRTKFPLATNAPAPLFVAVGTEGTVVGSGGAGLRISTHMGEVYFVHEADLEAKLEIIALPLTAKPKYPVIPGWITNIQRIATEVIYKDWHFAVVPELDGLLPGLPPVAAYLQVSFKAKDWDDPGALPKAQQSRKWRLSRHMTKSEVVQTCLAAVLTAEEHEAREQFTYQGKRVFGPHINVDALVAVAHQLEVRK